MRIENGIHYYERESTEREGFAVRPPKGYPLDKSCPVWLVIHGIGELSDGKIVNLENVILGTDFDGPGPRTREDVVLYQSMRDKADQLGHIIVVVAYKDQFNPNDVDYVMDSVERDFNVDRTREAIIGFSLGGGAVLREITSSLPAAGRWALAVACAPVNWATNLQYIVDAKLQLIGCSYQTDPRVSSSNIRGVITNLNKLNPEIKPVYIEFPGEAHGSMSEIQAGTHALIPQHIMDYLQSVSTENRKQYPTSGVIVKPTDPVQPVSILTAKATYTGTGPSIKLDGRQSTGWKSAKWQITKVPDGVNIWAPIITAGAGYITADATLPKQGQYVIDLIVTGSDGLTAKDTVTIDYGIIVPKTVHGFDSATDLITYSDGTTEKGQAVFSAGKWVIKNSAGQPLNF